MHLMHGNSTTWIQQTNIHTNQWAGEQRWTENRKKRTGDKQLQWQKWQTGWAAKKRRQQRMCTFRSLQGEQHGGEMVWINSGQRRAQMWTRGCSPPPPPEQVGPTELALTAQIINHLHSYRETKIHVTFRKFTPIGHTFSENLISTSTMPLPAMITNLWV